MSQGPVPFLYCDLYKRAHSEKTWSDLSLQVFSMPNLKFIASTVPEIKRSAKIPKVGQVTPPPHGPFWPNFAFFFLELTVLHFFSLELTAVRLRAKFKVCSFNHSWNIGGGKIPKMGHVTPTWLLVPRTHNKFGDRSFSAAGPRLWNDLPPGLRWPGLSFDSFRRSLKTHLFGAR